MWSSGETEAESVDLGVLMRQMAGDATGLDKPPGISSEPRGP